jgi:diacylglycerol kinase family enzyme
MLPPGAIAVILNPGAGTAIGRPNIGAELVELFRAAGRDAEISALHEGEHPDAVIKRASEKAAIVVAAGGDGTVCSVASAVLGSSAALGILPLGTLNHFARDLRIPFDLREAISVVAAGRIGHVDVGMANDRVFVNNSSIGIYPSIVDVREALRKQGHRKWPAMAIAALRVLRRYRGVKVSLDIDGRRRTWRTPFVFVGNNEYTIDGIGLGARARLDKGQLFIYVTPRLRARDLPLLFAKALIGRARQSGEFEIMPATEVWIHTSRSRHVQVAFDGEVTRMRTPLHYRTRPDALRVVLPGT